MIFPPDFVSQMQELLGSKTGDFFKALNYAPATSIRLNPAKSSHLAFSEKVKWCSHGYFIEPRPVFTLDPLFHAGSYYVQEASSMFIEEAVNQLNLKVPGLRVLDLCAAPGGKSTHLLSLLHAESLLVSNEVIRSRVKILEENLVKWGYSNYVITNNEAKDFSVLENYFDAIVCDAPCSGEGMFRKDAEAVTHWSKDAVRFCSQRQKRIIADVLPALKPGGYLIFSTCTFNIEENEKIAHSLFNDFGLTEVQLNTSSFPEIFKNHGKSTLRFYPHMVKSEGFTLTVFQKPVAYFNSAYLPGNKYKEVKPEGVFNNESDYFFYTHSNLVSAIPKKLVNDAYWLQDKLKVLKAGTDIFILKGKDKIPTHELAMSININPKYFKTTDIDKQSALKYLKGETQFDIDGEKGFYLVTYSNQPLGFLKKINNRFNNLYPRNQFIRMSIDNTVKNEYDY